MEKKKNPLTYRDAGVDIEAGEALVEKIKAKVKSTYGERVVAGVGGFASLYQCGDRYLAAGTDGVGSKLKLAFDLNIHHTIGIDLVAMCTNDILCTGATPLFFMDYLAIGRLDVSIAEKIVEGVLEGCHQAGAALIGGETAEMPGIYREGEYDLAGFAVGEVFPGKILDGNLITEGDTLIGLPSSGFHANGFSLIRKLLNEGEEDLKRELLAPTLIYEKQVRELLERELIHGLAHITGGGFLNIPRMNNTFDYFIEDDTFWREAPPFMKFIIKRSGLSLPELQRTFNMGLGLVLATSYPNQVLEYLKEKELKGYLLGSVRRGQGQVFFQGKKL